MRFLFLAVLAIYSFALKAEDKTPDMEASLLVDEFLKVVAADEPFPYESEMRFLGGNSFLGLALYIQAGKLDDRTGKWKDEIPQKSLLGMLLQKHKDIFAQPANTRRISMLVPGESSQTMLLVLIFQRELSPKAFDFIASANDNAKVIIFAISNYARPSIDLLHSSVNGQNIPYLIGFRLEKKTVKSGGRMISKEMPFVSEALLKSLQ